MGGLQDNQSAQIIGSARLLGLLRIYIPSWILDWPMTREADGSWYRSGRLFGIPLGPINDFFLRPVVDGQLKRAKYFDLWLKARNGRDFFYLEYA